MTWIHPPDEVVYFRDALLATLTIGTTIGIVAGTCHYPSADPLEDTLPLLAIDTSDLEGQRDTVGGSILVGKFDATILFPDSIDVGTIEGYRYKIARELVEWMTESLAITKVRVSRCQLPSSGMSAAGDGGNTEHAVSFSGLTIEAWFEG